MLTRYARELDVLPETYIYALRADVASLAELIGRSRSRPLVAIGSGGALSVARLACTLHELLNRQPACPMTPFGFFRSGLALGGATVLCISANGSNPDILAAFQQAALQEPASLGVLCGNPEGQLVTNASRLGWVQREVLDVPHADGFLATHSALGFALFLTRAFGRAVSGEEPPTTLPGLFQRRSWAAVRQHLRALTTPLWNSRTLVLIHSPTVEAAAFDIESRFTEAALCNVQLCDYRNFGHGRHHWLAKMADSSAVLSLASPADAELAERTLGLIPATIPRASIVFQGPPGASLLSALVASIVLPEIIAPLRGIDPGKPGVPPFGRKLYHLSALRRRSALGTEQEARAIERKTGATPEVLNAQGHLTFWRSAHRRYVQRLHSATFDSLVLDYDGTLCEVDARFDKMTPAVVDELAQLVRRGVQVVIATGRGDSAMAALRAAFERTLWPRLLVGLNNGSRIFQLDSDSPLRQQPATPELDAVAERLRADHCLSGAATVHASGCTVSVRPNPVASLPHVTDRVRTIVQTDGAPLCLRESTHSVDVSPHGVSKRAVLDFLRQERGSVEPLAIGDRGDPAGNDFDLLHACLSLSVDRVSSDPEHCWNLSPAGTRFVAATRAYLRAIRPGRKGLFRLTRITSSAT